MERIKPQLQEVKQIYKREKNTSKPNSLKMKKERKLNSGFKKIDYFQKVITIRLALTSQQQLLKPEHNGQINMLKENNSPLRVQYPEKKKNSKNKDERKTSSDKGKLQKSLSEFLTFPVSWPLWHSGETYDHFLRIRSLNT